MKVVDIDNFMYETGLKIAFNYSDYTFREISGKSYNDIKCRINIYNCKHNCHISCTNDDIKDCTYINFF